MTITADPVGFIGLGRLGVPLAANLVEAGLPVVVCTRGRSTELVDLGASVAGDGTPRAVAASARIVFTCLPNAEALDAVVDGDDGLLSVDGEAPIVVELSTASPDVKARIREALVARGGELLDAPVSGTPTMAKMKMATVYASGERAAYDAVAEQIAALSPSGVYVGELGAGAAFKYVANHLAFVHVTAAAEAMAFAKTAGLDLARVAEVISASPGASSGQFAIRGPLMAQEKFESKLVTVDTMREVLDQITEAAGAVGARVPLLDVVRGLYDDFAAAGEGDSDPGKLMQALQSPASGS